MDHRITALKAQKRNGNRVNVYLDDEFAFGLARIVAAWLYVGQTLNEEQIASLQKQDADEVAFQTALRLLNYRARTESEIRSRLEKKGFLEPAIEGVIERLHKAQLLDDAQFAQAWVENQSNFRPRGRRMLKMELRLKGVDDEIIESALESANDEENLAYQAAERQAQRWAGLEWQEFRVKLSQFLGRRGFSYGTAVPVVKRLWEELRRTGDSTQPGDANDIDD